MKKLLLLGALMSCTALIPGREFWLHPEKFIYKIGERINIKFLHGENYEGKNWSGTRSGIKALKLYYANVTDDCQDQLSEAAQGDSLQMAFFEEGTMMFTFTGQNEPGANAGDSTVHSAKTLVQVGNKMTPTFKRQTQLPIDIIPADNPFGLTDGKKLKVKLYFQKKPLANTAVLLWHRNNEQTVKRELLTDNKGEVEFPIFIAGRWMISTAKIVNAGKETNGGRLHYLGSLTWGYMR
jgi:uncharacterized GH25 family protein